MRAKILMALGLLFVLSLALAPAIQAKTVKYTFNDVSINGEIVEIEASVKENNKGAFTVCTYFSDDYAEVLGYYQEAESAGDTAEDVLDYCVAHFDERTH